MKTLVAHYPTGTYPIYVGAHLLAEKDLFHPHIHGQQVFIVTQENIGKSYLSILQESLKDYICTVFYLPNGEQHKNHTEWQRIIDALVQNGHERSTTLIALGGGMVSDITGFAAACYQRGVHYLSIPTSLIAQVDAAIGGKTAINHNQRKNLIGAFHQPQCVVVDTSLLASLPEREWIAGLAEVIKYSLIADADFFDWLEQNLSALMVQEKSALEYAIIKSINLKNAIVARDVEDRGIRQILNFGHTFGHALETYFGLEGILHGEAVALGMQIAVELSVQDKLLAPSVAKRIITLLKAAKLLTIPLPDSEEWAHYLWQDKKVRDGKLQLILLEDIGKPIQGSKDSLSLDSLSTKCSL